MGEKELQPRSKKSKRKGDRKTKQLTQQQEYDALAVKLEKFKSVDSSTLTKFSKFPLSTPTLRGLKRCSYTEPTQVQRLALPLALQGLDVVVDSKTGTGKTLCFIVPLLERLYLDKWAQNYGLAAIVLNPTGELATQTQEILKLVGHFHTFSSAAVIGGKDLMAEKQSISRLNIVVCTPGRLLQHLRESEALDLSKLKMLVIDEADQCLSQEFSRQVDAILEELPKNRQTLLFSATQTRNVSDLLRSGCKSPRFISTIHNSDVSTPVMLKQSYMVIEAHQKLNFLYNFVKTHVKKKILVFVATSKQVKFFTKVLQWMKINSHVCSMHSDMSVPKRIENFESFLGKERGVLLATDVAARGLDFAAVDWVLQVDCPASCHYYRHRAGRTARYFSDGSSLLLLTGAERRFAEQLRADSVSISELRAEHGRLQDIRPSVQDLLVRDVTHRDMAEAALIAYMKHIASMKDETVFDVSSIHKDELGRSYGLVVVPSFSLVEREVEEGEDLHGRRKADTAKSTVVVAEMVVKERKLSKLLRPVSEEAAAGFAALRRGSCLSVLPKGRPQGAGEESAAPSGLSIAALRASIAQTAKEDHRAHKLKLRARRKPSKAQQGSAAPRGSGEGSSDEDSLDEATKRIIEDLPDPEGWEEPVNKRKLEAEENKASKRRKTEESSSEAESEEEEESPSEGGEEDLAAMEARALSLLNGGR